MKCLRFLELYKYLVSCLYFNGTKRCCHCFHFDINSVASHSARTLLTNTPHLVKKTTTTTTYAYKFSRLFIEKTVTKSASNTGETRLQSLL